MTRMPSFRKLNQAGFDHVLVAVFFVVIIALGGAYYLVQSHAAAPAIWKGVLAQGSATSGYCLTSATGANKSKVALQPCTANNSAQSWSMFNAGTASFMGVSGVTEYYLQNGAGTNECLNNPYGSKTNGTQLQIYTCNAQDKNALWVWGSALTGKGFNAHQLISVATISGTSGLCLDDAYGSHTAGNKVQVWHCSGTTSTNMANQSWFEASSPTGTGGGASGFVTTSGTKLMLNGSAYKFIGFDVGMAGVCWSNNWSTAQMDTYYSNLPANGMTRVFIVQPVGASFVSTIVNEAAKYHQHLIMVLGDDDSNCNDTNGAPSGAGSGKTAAYYQSGWRGQYLTWVNTIVPAYKNNTTVAMWEIANEPFGSGATGSQLGLATMQSYINGTASAIRADDPNHLIAIGSINIGSYGSLSNYEAAQSGPNINVLDFHDYAWDFENGATVSGNFSQEQTAAKSLNKPYMIDEAGVEAGSCSSSAPADSASGHGLTLNNRVSYLTNKANSYLSGGASGVDFWDYELVPQSNCSYEVVPSSDPMISAVKNYKVPN